MSHLLAYKTTSGCTRHVTSRVKTFKVVGVKSIDEFAGLLCVSPSGESDEYHIGSDTEYTVLCHKENG